LSRTLRITAPAKSASSVRWSSGGRRSRGDVLGDDDELTEEVFRQLEIERQVKADHAAPDVSNPTFDVIISGEGLIECGLPVRNRIDRRALQIAKPVALVAKIYVGGEVKGRAEPAPLLS
jgi:hypothetical protein